MASRRHAANRVALCRHERAGVILLRTCLSQDLRAWWPRICAGGALAGHDYTDDNVARAVGQHFARACGREACVVYITTENPASFVAFKTPMPRPQPV